MKRACVWIAGACAATLLVAGCRPSIVSGPVDAALMQTEGIAKALASDELAGARKEAERLLTFLDNHEIAPQALRPAAEALRDSADLAAAREAFAELSKVAVPLAEGKPAFRIFHCPDTPQGYGKWVQMDTRVTNPYGGTKHLRCGELIQ